MYRGKGAGKLSGGTVVKCMAGAWDFRSECKTMLVGGCCKDAVRPGSFYG